MKTRTALILAALLVSAAVSCVNRAGDPAPEQTFPRAEDFAADFEQDFPGSVCELFPAEDVTAELLTSRSAWDSYLVEVSTGTVTTDDGDGRLDLPEPYNYISYRGVPFETSPGSRIVTYAVYEIHSDGEDDIVARYDYPLNAE